MRLLSRLSDAWTVASELRHALRTPRRVPGIVCVSVGGLRVGGVGKSLVARAVAALYADAGVPSAIVLRGYRGSARGPQQVHAYSNPQVVGDEALEHAREGFTVWVARERVEGVARAREGGAVVAVLDDGFQHHALARDLDLVLVTAADACASTLPAGPLREPVGALGRADGVLTLDPEPFRVGALCPTALGLELRGLRDAQGALEDVARWRGARVRLVTGIARPERVSGLLARNGLEPCQHWQYPDHHPIPTAAWTTPGADLVLTTAKDAARSDPWASAEGPPRRTVAVRTTLPGDLSARLLGLAPRR
ncbi:MAG: tetraacyldisaccharide 4'-kinase [Deltaproteobacteria bacterium]|nr:tetraacyldisaccharide 4'-kinase [Deltaproteobacteria bacterium]